MDLFVDKKEYDGENVVYKSGIAMSIPQGHVGLLFPRSSNAKMQLLLTNSVGVIDSGYRGDIMAKFRMMPDNASHNKHKEYEVGDRFAQLIIMPYPVIDLEEVEELDNSSRGACGYGSSGK